MKTLLCFLGVAFLPIYARTTSGSVQGDHLSHNRLTATNQARIPIRYNTHPLKRWTQRARQQHREFKEGLLKDILDREQESFLWDQTGFGSSRRATSLSDRYISGKGSRKSRDRLDAPEISHHKAKQDKFWEDILKCLSIPEE
eukprot:jgi/Bigna1/144043/aug1.83_g18751